MGLAGQWFAEAKWEKVSMFCKRLAAGTQHLGKTKPTSGAQHRGTQLSESRERGQWAANQDLGQVPSSPKRSHRSHITHAPSVDARVGQKEGSSK